MRRAIISTLLLAGAFSLFGYVRSTNGPGGIPLQRTDFTDIRFLVNNQTAAGMTNNDGGVIITSDSDPMAAIRSSIATWNSVPGSAIHLADLATTALTDNSNDGEEVIVFTDTPEHRSVVGSALAVTWVSWNPDTGNITDTDIIFNPRITFSTNLEPNAPDLESTVTHEMGHAMGMTHTNLLGATMYQAGLDGTDYQASLSTDEIAFANTVYPAPGGGNNLGTLAGSVRTTQGLGLRGVFVTAIDLDTFAHVSTLSSLNQPSYRIEGLPPGRYMVYMEPMDGPVFPGNVNKILDSMVDIGFKPAAWGSFAAPNEVVVPAGGIATADINAPPGISGFDIERIGEFRGSGGSRSYSAREWFAGETLEMLLWGPGLDGTITEGDIHIFAPGVTARPGTLFVDNSWTHNGRPALNLTVDVAPTAPSGLGTVVVAKNGEAVPWSGGIVISGAVTNPSFVAANLRNAASGLAGDVAPESWADLYGEDLATQFLINENLTSSLGGTSVTLIDSTGAAHACRIRFIAADVFGTLDRIQFLMPSNPALGAATLRVRNASGGQGEAVIQVGAVGPGLFAANENGQGPAAAVYQLFDATPAQIDAGITFTPVAVGARQNIPLSLGGPSDGLYISFYGTGFRRNGSFTCRIGGVVVPAVGAVAQGQFEGLDQAVCGPVPRALAGSIDATAELGFDGAPANTVTVSFE